MNHNIKRLTNCEINTHHVIKNLSTVIDDQQMEIKKLNKQILKIKCEDDEIIKKLDDKLFVLREEFRNIQEENQQLLDKIKHFSTAQSPTDQKID
jgi:hypothetical protein